VAGGVGSIDHPGTCISPVASTLAERPDGSSEPCDSQGTMSDFDQQIRKAVGEMPLTAQVMTALRTGGASLLTYAGN